MYELSSINVGDKLVCAQRRSSYFTVGKSYEVLQIMNSGNLAIRDDENDKYYVDKGDMKDFGFVPEGSDTHSKLNEYLEIGIGDSIKCSRDMNVFRVGNKYEVVHRRQGTETLYVRVPDRSNQMIQFALYLTYFEPPKLDETNLSPQDYMSMVDASIDTRDEVWFKEILLKAEEQPNMI